MVEVTVMVNNECLYWTLREDLVKILLELVNKKQDKFELVFIEKQVRQIILHSFQVIVALSFGFFQS